MEIHSSSLSFQPAKPRVKNTNDHSQLSNKNLNNNDLQNKPALTLPSPKAIKNSLNTADLQQLSTELEKQNKTTSQSRTDRAVNAYIQENIQPLKNQRSQLISGIDTFA